MVLSHYVYVHKKGKIKKLNPNPNPFNDKYVREKNQIKIQPRPF